MHPPLLDGENICQFVDYLITMGRAMGQNFQEYYCILRTIFGQPPSKDDIYRWLNDKLSLNRYDGKSTTCIKDMSAVSEIFIKRCQEMGAKYFQVKRCTS